MTADIKEDRLVQFNRELAQIEFLWNKKSAKFVESKNDEKTCSKIAELLGCTLQVLQTVPTVYDEELTLKCMNFCYYAGKNKSGREQLVAWNGLEIFKRAIQACLTRDYSTQMTKDLDSIICSLCLRCIPLKPLPVSQTEHPITFVLPESDVCRCPAEEASESDEDNLIEIGHVPDVSEFLAAKLKATRSTDDEPQQQRKISFSSQQSPTIAASFSGDASTNRKCSTGMNPATISGANSINQTFDPAAAAAACTRCTTVADLENYRKFCAEFGDNLMPSILNVSRFDENTPPNIFSVSAERNYATIGAKPDDLRPSLRRASRSTVDMVKKMEPRLTAKNRCSSEQKFNREFSRRMRNPSDPRPESGEASPERLTESKHGSTVSLIDNINGLQNGLEPNSKPAEQTQMTNRNHCYYTDKMYAEAAKSVKHINQFVKLAYPDYVSAHPYLSLRPFKDYRQALLLTVLDEVKRAEKNDFEVRTVYDLDELVANEREPYELTNNDEQNVGTMDSKCNHLTFESRFENGNLRKVVQVRPYEYQLILSNDINQIVEHYAWFYFEVSNIEQDVPYVFKVVNSVKSKSLVSAGMQPCVFSVTEAKCGRFGWARCGSGAVYYRNYLRPNLAASKRPPTAERCFSTSAFTISFQHRGDICYIAYHYPYTYSSLKANLIRWQKLMSNRAKNIAGPGILYRKDILGHTLAGNPIHLLTITAQGTGEQIALRDVIMLTARVHPGESNASWMMHGTIDYLLSDRPMAQKARNLYVFKLIPILNPDGVINGNHRCSLTGQDLNRQWLVPSQTLHPTIYHAKQFLKFLCTIGKKPLVFCDYHGHSRKKNIFIYGNNPDCSWRKEDRNIIHDWEFYGFQVGTRELIEMGEQMVESLVTLREYMDCNRTPTRKFEISDDDSDDSGLA